MDCNIIRDLIPLSIDACCSEESEKLIAAHIAACPQCRAMREQMEVRPEILSPDPPSGELRRINIWAASVLQSVLLFLSFIVITAGVSMEAAVPSGLMNGFWAFTLVIPATGFLLSLANWYFVRVYKSRKAFSACSMLVTLAITLCAYIWGGFHYECSILDLVELLHGRPIGEVFEILLSQLFYYGRGFLLTAVFCVLSKVLSNKYARLLGKE